MNSVGLLQQATINWLAADDVAELSLPHAESLVNHVNSAAARVWRQLPAHYRRRPWSQSLDAPKTGTATVSNGSRALTISISGVSLSSTSWQYARLIINGVENQVVNNGIAGSQWSADLLHPWTGASGTYAATIYQDAALQPVTQLLIDRIVAPVVDTVSRCTYFPVSTIQEGRASSYGRFYTLSRVRFPEPDGDDVVRSLFEVTSSDQSRLFESTVDVIPLPLGILDASKARALPYDDEIAGIVADAVGVELQRHPKFRGGSLDPAIGAITRLNAIPRRPDNSLATIGTPEGW